MAYPNEMGLVYKEESEPRDSITMSDDDLMGIINDEIANSSGQDDELSGEYEKAIDAYFGKPDGTEIAGRDQSISMDIADSVEATLAQIIPLYTSGEHTRFNAVSAEDEAQAQLESDFVTHIIVQENSGFQMFYDAFKDALIMKTGLTKAYVDDRYVSSTFEYTGLSEIEVAQILQPKEPDTEINLLSITEEADGISATISKVKHIKKLRVDSIAPDDFGYKSDHSSINLAECEFCYHKMVVPRYRLIEMGFDEEVVNELPPYDQDTDEVDVARNQLSDESDHHSSDPATDAILLHDSYIMIDYDGDGVAERRRVISCGSVKLSNEPFPCVPISAGTPFIMPHRFLGLSFYDKLKDIQRSKTKVQRQYWDNLNANNNRRLIANMRQVLDPDSLLLSKPGGVIKVKDINAVVPLPVDDIGPSCISALAYLDKRRAERVGSALDMQTEQQTVNNDTAHGAERLVSAREEMSAMIGRTLGETLVKGTYLATHKLLKYFFPHPMQAQIGGQWQQTTPRQWLDREDVSITTGMSIGEKNRMRAALNSILGLQIKAAEEDKGGILVSDSLIYNTLTDLVRTDGVGTVNRYWINPATPPAQEERANKDQTSQEMQEMQQELMQSQSDLQKAIGQAEMLKSTNGKLKNDLDMIKAQLDQVDASGELAFKYEKLYQDNATELTIAGANAETQQANAETIEE